MKMSKDQITQIKYRKNITSAIITINVAIVFFIMSILSVTIINLSNSDNVVLFWLLWVSLLLLLIGVSIYYIEFKLSKQLDTKYPLTKDINLEEIYFSTKEEKSIENGWQFIAEYWWLFKLVNSSII